MKFRLKKHDDAIVLESFLKAVGAHEDYQFIRFMIKDGKIYVNGEQEYARRRLLFIGDEISFEDKFYKICAYDDFDDADRENRNEKEKKKPYDGPKEFIFHHKTPLNWTEKYRKKD
jgi:ribosome-associated protein YbcJ (S4-like RNA binding protein)